MGRKIKPIGLRRKAISISLPLDVISHLDNIVLSTEGATRSRLIEQLLRTSMDKGQTTLKQFYTYWNCSGCSYSWKTKDRELDYVWCPKCTKQMDKKIDFKGNKLEREDGEEE